MVAALGPPGVVAGRGPRANAVRGEVACLRWRQAAHQRRRTGWYLTRLDARGGEQRLIVDVALEQLAADTHRAAPQCDDDADSAAAPSAPRALARARLLLQRPTRASARAAAPPSGWAP
jgi:hypothetical protein